MMAIGALLLQGNVDMLVSYVCRIDTAGVIKKVKSLFYGHPELILGFNTFLPKGYEIKMEDLPTYQNPAPTKSPVEFDQAITYVNRIKQTFANDERVYKAFLEILNQYRKGQKTIQSVYEEVALLFRNHEDLLNEFSYFLPDAAPAQVRRPAQAPRRAGGAYGAAASKPKRAPPPLRRDDPKVQREYAFVHKVKNRIKNDASYGDFLKCLNMYTDDIISKEELIELQKDIIGKHHDLMAALNEFLLRCELGPEDPYSRPYQARDRSRHTSINHKYISMPISELDVGSWERVTPSYVQLPQSYPKLKATGRDPLMAQLFNDDWVSVTSGSEDYNFKHYRKNQYEDFLFMAEDDHFELDMIMDQNSSAIKAMMPLVEQISEVPEDEKASWKLSEGALRAFHYRAVSRVYGEGAQQMLSLLRQNPAVALPTILPRLEQKALEWAETKKEMMAHWQTIFKENYKKSLDHRSFYFKQAEKKNLTPKLLFAELKDISDRKKNEKVSVLLSLAGRVDFASRVSPHIICDFSDDQIALDTSRIIQAGIDNMLTTDASVRVRNLYHNFFETFFELKCTCAEAEERRSAINAGNPAPGTTPRAARAAAPAEASTDAEGTAATGDEEDDAAGGAETLNVFANGNDREPGTDMESEDTEKQDIEMGEEEKSEEETDQTEFIGCRPVAPLVNGAQSVASDAVPTQPEQNGVMHSHCKIFYGNESLFVLLRLHQILLERMKSARQCAAAQSESETEAEKLHAKFMSMAYALIEGNTDPSAYEDDCRALLGTNSYQLFTLDKLVQKLVRQAQACLVEDVSHRLLDLWKYENCRSVPVVDAVYYANARIVLGDDTAVRFEYTPEKSMTFQYLEGEKSEVPSVLDARFRSYIDEFVAPDEQGLVSGAFTATEYAETEEGPENGRICLKRNLEAAGINDDADAAASKAIQDTLAISNGLECKLGATVQHKIKSIAYVLGTEDYLHKRRKIPTNKNLDADKVKKFRSWIQEQASKEPLETDQETQSTRKPLAVIEI